MVGSLRWFPTIIFIMFRSKSTSRSEAHGGATGNERTGTEALNRLTTGAVYIGTVVNSDSDTKLLDVAANGTVVRNCIAASSIASFVLGFDQIILPPVGSSVLLAYTDSTSVAIGLGTSVGDSDGQFSGRATGGVSAVLGAAEILKPKRSSDVTKVAVGPGYTQPADALPGEFGIGNNMGPLLLMLTNFAQLSSTTAAMVETHLVNEMVRMVSDYYVHHHAAGDTMIWNNGRLNWEDHLTSYPHEAAGKLNADDELSPVVGGALADPTEACQGDVINATGRWRFSAYRGFLGDLVHSWVTDPTKAISTYGKSASRAGKMRSWIGADGTLMLQTCAGVHIEVTPTITIPTITAKWDDTELKDQLENLDAEFLALWGSGPDWSDIDVACWQMRSYSRYLSQFHSLSRFLQMEKNGGCIVPTEEDALDPSPTCAEEDKKAANPTGESPYKGRAIISMDASGSISLVSNSLGSVIMNQGNIQITAPGNIELNAGGVLSVNAKDVSLKAARNMEIVAVVGGLAIKARTVIKALCERGRVWLKSDAILNEIYKTPELGFGAPPAEFEQCGIVLDATSSRILNHGAEGATLMATAAGSKVDVYGESGEVNIASSVAVNVIAPNTRLKTANTVIAGANVHFDIGTFTMQSGVRISGNTLQLSGSVISSGVVVAPGFQGNVATISVPDELRQPDVSRPDGIVTQIGLTLSLNTTQAIFPALTDELNKYNWEFSVWDNVRDVTDPDSIKASLWYDALRNDEEMQQEVASLSQSDSKLMASKRSNGASYPFPGQNAQTFYFRSSVPNLNKPLTTKYSKSLLGGVSSMVAVPTIFYYKKDK